MSSKEKRVLFASPAGILRPKEPLHCADDCWLKQYGHSNQSDDQPEPPRQGPISHPFEAPWNIYQSLASGQTRILCLLPGPFHAPPECTLSTMEIGSDDEPRSHEYEVLSYMWGSTDRSCSITCDGSPFGITQNLYDALLHLRYPDRGRPILVDAICLYLDRYRTKHCKKLRLRPLFFEGFRFAIVYPKIASFSGIISSAVNAEDARVETTL